MYMRLGFAVAINVDPDVLLVDEVLAVGDEAFTHKCLDKFAEFRRRGRTVLLVTHSLDLVTRFCDEALWLDGGVARAQGDPKRVVDAYLTDGRRARDRAAGAATTIDGESRPDPRRQSGDESPSTPDPTTAGHVPGRRRTLGIARGRDRRRRAGRRERRSRRTSSSRASAWRSGCACARGTLVQRLRLRRRHLQRRRRLLLRHEHAHRGRHGRRGRRRRRGALRRSTASISSTGTYKLDVAVHRQNGAPYDYHRLLYTFRVDVAAQGSRHLPAAAPVDVLRRRPHAGPAMKGAARADLIRRPGGRRVRRAGPRTRRDGRLHQRRVRPAAPGPRPLPARTRARSATR